MLPAADSAWARWLRLPAIAGAVFLLAIATTEYFRAVGLPVAVVRPVTGFAVGVFLAYGATNWPAVLCAALVASVFDGVSLLGAMLVAGSTTGGAMLAARLLNHKVRFDVTLSSFDDYLRLLVAGGLPCALVSGIGGTAGLWIDTAGTLDQPIEALVRWWMGDFMGVLLVAPMVLVWRIRPEVPTDLGRRLAILGFVAATLVAGYAIFLGGFSSLVGKVALGYWIFLFVVWGAARFGMPGVVWVLAASLLLALGGAALHVGFFAEDVARTGLMNVWFYFLALSTVGVGLASVVNAFRKAEAEIREMAMHDSLTGLANRHLLADRIRQAVAVARREERRVGLIFHDLDNFKPVNDKFGHHVGDQLLREVAKRVCKVVREADTVGRIGGDEFVIVLPLIDGTEEARLVAEKIRIALAEPFQLGEARVSISTSIGIALFPDHADSEDRLLIAADSAMYAAKRAGRDSVQVYADNMSNRQDVPVGLEDIRRAGATC